MVDGKSGAPGKSASNNITLVLLGAGILLGITACAPQYEYVGSQPCPPPAYTLSQSSVRTGEDLKISASNATCDPRYGERAQIQIELLNEQNEVLFTELAPMSDAGSFDHTLRIPASTKPGSYGISATPYELDWCDDTGRNNRIANPGSVQSGMVVVRTACATPYVAFRVAK